MKRILVTGGRGFIGTQLCNRLSAQPDTEVIAVDNMRCPSFMPLNKNVQIFEADVSDPMVFITLLQAFHEVHEVYHLASLASPVWYKRFPLETIRTNVMGTHNMCELALEWGAKLVLSSTSEVYGDPETTPQTEKYNGNVSTRTDRACYDESKRCAETIVYEFAKRGLNSTIVRIFNTYGPGMRHDDGRVVSEFIMRALQDENLIVCNGGQQTRSFCYIDDLLDYLVLAMKTAHPGPINIGNDKEISILDLAQLIGNILGEQLHIEYKIVDDGDPKRRCPDLTTARVVLGCMPETELTTGLIYTVDYFRKWLQYKDA